MLFIGLVFDVSVSKFADEFLEGFVKENLLPLCMSINSESLKLLKDDQRKIVLTVVEDENDEKSKDLVKLLKAAASANRDLLFAFVGLKQWEDFVETFGIDKKSRLPKMVVWDGNEEYFSVSGSESLGKEDQGSEITRFLAGFREGKMEAKKITGPSFMSFIKSSDGLIPLFIIGCVVVTILMLILTIGKVGDGYSGVSSREERYLATSSSPKPELGDAHRSRDKED
ncbi:protein disulfide isomerase-like [Dionaea muscipula]